MFFFFSGLQRFLHVIEAKDQPGPKKKHTNLNEGNESLHITKSITAVDSYRLRVRL